jgi:hypothetical protein
VHRDPQAAGGNGVQAAPVGLVISTNVGGEVVVASVAVSAWWGGPLRLAGRGDRDLGASRYRAAPGVEPPGRRGPPGEGDIESKHVVLLHGFMKKRKATPKREVEGIKDDV